MEKKETTSVWTYDTAFEDFQKKSGREKGKSTDYLLSAKNDWHPPIYFRFTDYYMNDRIIDDQGNAIKFQYNHWWLMFSYIQDASQYTSLCYMLNDKDITIPDLLDKYGFAYERINSSNSDKTHIDFFLIKDIDKLCLLIEKLLKIKNTA